MRQLQDPPGITITMQQKETRTDKFLRKSLSELESKRERLKTVNEMIDQECESDPEMRDLKQKYEEAKTRYKLGKEAFLNEPDRRSMAEDKMELTRDIKELTAILSKSMVLYSVQEKKDDFSDDDGEKRYIVMGAKASKKKQPSLFDWINETSLDIISVESTEQTN
jgi:uncharacterized DUF497 family protein